MKWDTFAFNLFEMKYFCFVRFVFWGIPRNEEHWITRKLSLGRHYRRWREVERLRGCEGVPLMWKAKVELIEIWLPQPELFLHYLSAAGDGWTVPVTRFLTKRPWFPRSWCECWQTGMMIFWKPGFKSGFGSWFSQRSKPNVTSDVTSRQVARLVIPDCSYFWERSSAFEKRNGSFE